MRVLIGSAVFAAMLSLPLAVSAAVTEKHVKTPAAKSTQTQEATNLRHTHRHCHVVVTLGHSKKRCHTHRHNKVVHHGPKYH